MNTDRRGAAARSRLVVSAIAALTLLLALLLGRLYQQRSVPALSVWAVSGMERVGQHDPPKDAATIEIYAARAEYEPFQVVIRAGKSRLTNVDVAVSDLRGPGGHIIPKASITLYREHYVYVGEPSPDPGGENRPLGAGWYPDALIPFTDPATQLPPAGGELRAVPFDLEPETNQPIWVDVFVPPDARAGHYTGTFSIRSDQGSRVGTFGITVWNFTLPLQPSLKSSFLLSRARNTNARSELLRHKLMPGGVTPADQGLLIERFGLSTTNVGLWSGAQIDNCTMRPAPPVGEFRAAAAEKAPGLALYNYTADEIDRCPDLFEAMKAWARHMHQAGIANLVTMTPVPELYDDGAGTGRSAVDIWVLLPKMYDSAPERVAEVLRKGDQVWSYNALVQDDYSPKWEIDFAPINFRIQPGFISQSLGLTGLLYWRVDNWTSDPWNNVQTYSVGDKRFPGEGMLVYPGRQVGIDGVVPSMRLKWLREGVEDYEYIELLKRRGSGRWALEVSRGIGADWSHWTHDPARLEAARRELGEALSAAGAALP